MSDCKALAKTNQFSSALAQVLMRHRGAEPQDELAQGGRILRFVIGGYEWTRQG